MNPKMPSLLLICLVIPLVLGACVSRPVETPESQNPAPAGATPILSTSATPAAALSSPPVATETTTVLPSPSSTVIPVDEEDCMAGCHIPDPNENIAAGAKPQPASHAGRTTCLVCHTTQAAPALPATHTGRLDPSCSVCHKQN